MELTGIAREDLEAKGFICDNKINLTFKGKEKDGIPDTYAFMIGRKHIETGELESCWKKDRDNGNTEELEKILLNAASVIEKQRRVGKHGPLESHEVIDYFIPYDIQESTKNIPTVTEDYVIGCMNGSWACEYEILLTCGEGAYRRIVLAHKSVNIGMVMWISDLEDEAERALRGKKDTIFKDIFNYDKETGESTLVMFDDLGEPFDYEIERVSDFLNMMVSVRCIKCEFVEDKE